MKIVDKRQELCILFKDITPGQTFTHKGVAYIKIDRPAGYTDYNCILLNTGRVYDMSPTEQITPVECELHIVD